MLTKESFPSIKLKRLVFIYEFYCKIEKKD